MPRCMLALVYTRVFPLKALARIRILSGIVREYSYVSHKFWHDLWHNNETQICFEMYQLNVKISTTRLKWLYPQKTLVITVQTSQKVTSSLDIKHTFFRRHILCKEINLYIMAIRNLSHNYPSLYLPYAVIKFFKDTYWQHFSDKKYQSIIF